MKSLHRPDLFAWSRFDEARNLDFNTFVWVRPKGNIVFDPLEASPHDVDHLVALGGVAWIVITNGDHLRATRALAARFGAKVAAPTAERAAIDLPVDRWLTDGEELVPGLRTIAMRGSKTPGEVAFHLAPDSVITGDLVRGARGGSLNMLQADKLIDPAAARASVAGLAAIPGVNAVLVGDGWCVFEGGSAKLAALVG